MQAVTIEIRVKIIYVDGNRCAFVYPVVALNSALDSLNPSPEGDGREINAIPWINPRVAFRRIVRRLGTAFLWEHTVE